MSNIEDEEKDLFEEELTNPVTSSYSVTTSSCNQ